MIKRLRNRLILINMILLSLTLMIIFSTIVVTSINRFKRDSYNDLEKDYNIFVKLNKANIQVDRLNETGLSDFFIDRSPFKTFFVTLDHDGNILSTESFDKQIEYQTIEDAVDSASDKALNKGTIKNLNFRYQVLNTKPRTIGFIDISFERDFISKQITSYVLIYIGSLAVFLLISIILAAAATKPAIQAWKNQQQFVSDVSHELRTPLTVMISYTSMLNNGKLIDANHKKWLDILDTEANHMKTLVENLLFLARTDNKTYDVNKTDIDLSDTVYQSSLLFEPLMFEKNIKLELNIQPNIKLNANIGQVKQLIGIFLDNAIKFSYENTKITVTLHLKGDEKVLSVNNFGEVIDKTDIANLFTRFKKMDTARTRLENSGYGLGLAIAKEITSIHNGEIRVTSNKQDGTKFSIYF